MGFGVFRRKPVRTTAELIRRYRLNASKWVQDIPSWRDTSIRFLLRASAFRDTVGRFRLQSVVQYRHTAARFVLRVQAFRDTAQRFRIQSTVQWRDTVSRFVLRALAYRDTSLRFRLQSVAAWRDTATRFKLHGQSWRNTNSRFLLKSAAAVRDTASRFRLQSAVDLRDTSTRFLLRATAYCDTAVRFRLQSSAQYRHTAARFVLRAQSWRDTTARFWLRAAASRDTSSRFWIRAAGYRDSAARYALRSQTVYRDSTLRFLLVATGAAVRDTLSRFVVRPGQTASPSADISLGGWTDQAGSTTNVYSAVVDQGTSTYAQSSLLPVNDTYIFAMQPLVDPGVSDGFRVDLSYMIDNVGSDGNLQITVQAGTTDCATRTFSSLPSDWKPDLFVMTSTEVSTFRSNGGFANPRIKVIATQTA